MKRHFAELEGVKVAVIGGGGKIALATAKAAAAQGAEIVLFDIDSEKARRAALGTRFRVAATLEEAVRDCDVVLLGTGKNTMPPEKRDRLPPSALIFSLSSPDIETRSTDEDAPDGSEDAADAVGHGSWHTDLAHPTYAFDFGVLNAEGAFEMFDPNHPHPWRLKTPSRKPEPTIQHRVVKSGGFPVNLIRRLRMTHPGREELLFMNVTECLAEVDAGGGQVSRHLPPWREQRVIDLFARHHPEHFEFAMNS